MTANENERLPVRPSKRLVDLVLSLLLLVLMTPVLLFLLPAMMLEYCLRRRSRGPLFFREPRISHGREFQILKFRTVRQSLIAATEGSRGTIKDLERDLANLTWCGRLVHRCYLDELPQIWNILRGDMSFVGPRPWPPADHYEQLSRGINTKGVIPCGLTGLTQCYKGVNSNGTDLDLAYIDAYRRLSATALLWYDLKILARSLWVLIQAQGL